MHKLKEKIKAEAANLGFSFANITLPKRPPHYQEYLDWITGDSAGEMSYLTRERTIATRGNPELLFPQAKSMIVLGLAYVLRSEAAAATPYAPIGRIASYALYPDYHRVLKQKTRALVAKIDQISNRRNRYRFFADSANLLEKDSAYLAGAGWIGKHSLLITPQAGSAQFLACILTDLELPADEPFATDLCGNCRKCVDACPAGCITEQHTLQADHCIAYLTIEYKGVIPRALRSSLGNRIFGCDVCQAACPLNRKDHYSSLEMSKPVIPAEVDLIDEILLTPERFASKYAGTPVLRSTFESFKRNLIIAMGNSHCRACLPVLEEIALNDPAWLLRLHAAWAIAAIDAEGSLPVLKYMLNQDSDERVKAEISLVLTGHI